MQPPPGIYFLVMAGPQLQAMVSQLLGVFSGAIGDMFNRILPPACPFQFQDLFGHLPTNFEGFVFALTVTYTNFGIWVQFPLMPSMGMLLY